MHTQILFASRFYVYSTLIFFSEAKTPPIIDSYGILNEKLYICECDILPFAGINLLVLLLLLSLVWSTKYNTHSHSWRTKQKYHVKEKNAADQNEKWKVHRKPTWKKPKNNNKNYARKLFYENGLWVNIPYLFTVRHQCGTIYNTVQCFQHILIHKTIRKKAPFAGSRICPVPLPSN